MTRAGTVLVKLEEIPKLLGLSEGHKVFGVVDGGEGAVGFIIAGPAMPERAENENAPYVEVVEPHVVGLLKDQAERARFECPGGWGYRNRMPCIAKYPEWTQ